MSGRLILLPHKTWNVWNREAIAKVRNDEKANEEELEKANEKKLKVESEARIEILRKRSRKKVHFADGEGDDDGTHKQVDEKIIFPEGEHINLFADYEHALGINGEHEKEKMERERAELKKGGANNIAPVALGGTQAERDKASPWWSTFTITGAPTRSSSLITNTNQDNKHIEDLKCRNQDSNNEDTSSEDEIGSHKKHKQSKQSKKKKKKKEKKKEKKSTRSHRKDSSNTDISIEQLRAKRLEREACERVRASEVLTAHNPTEEGLSSKRYNSQYFSSRR
mmetsp:Transcript_222/g.265  ORF Transcript_222/g.265 Transcript_222/m.265 type:complete len:281 (+) Transcript_222:93-935(+)